MKWLEVVRILPAEKKNPGRGRRKGRVVGRVRGWAAFRGVSLPKERASLAGSKNHPNPLEKKATQKAKTRRNQAVPGYPVFHEVSRAELPSQQATRSPAPLEATRVGSGGFWTGWMAVRMAFRHQTGSLSSVVWWVLLCGDFSSAGAQGTQAPFARRSV